MEPHIKAKCNGAISTQSQEEGSRDVEGGAEGGGGRHGTGNTTTTATTTTTTTTTTATTTTGTLNIVPPEPASGEVDPNAIVIGDVSGCMVMELQGGVVRVQDHSRPTDTQAPSDPYLLDVVRDDQDHQQQPPGQVSVPISHQQLHQSAVQGGKGELVLDAAQKKNKVGKCANKDSSNNIKMNPKLKTEAVQEFMSRWNFKQVLVKPQYGAILDPDPGFIEDNVTVGEIEGEGDAARPRRKSAKKARLRWKSIHDVDCITKSSSRKDKRMSLGPAKHQVNTAKDVKAGGVVKEELPVWAEQLTSVQVLEGKWVVGVAASSAVLHQILEGHSRSVLCDYVKSHPSQLQARHQLRAQQSRLMWHHQCIRFDGVPFTIFSSDDLKCAFGMNYKLKRKDPGGGSSKAAGDKKDMGEESGEVDCPSAKVPDTTTTQQATEGHKAAVPAKKQYRNVFFTNCPAKIRVKVIVKYPAYAISMQAPSSSRRKMLKSLRQDLQQDRKVAREEVYHITLPLSCVHNHQLSGQTRSVHPSILHKIRELVGDGVTAPKAIKAVLDRHVECYYAEDAILPHPEDRAYYPRLKDIGNFVYSYCKRMGISAKRKNSGDAPFETGSHKRKRKNTNRKGGRSDEENEGGCCDTVAGAGGSILPLQASTLQEAVQTFCTDDKSPVAGLEEGGSRECAAGEVASITAPRIGAAQEASSVAEIVRHQLDTLRSLTYTLEDGNSLQEIHQALQAILSPFVTPQNQQTVQEGAIPEATATFIIQDPIVESLPSSAPVAQCLPEAPQAEHIEVSGREGQAAAGTTAETSKPRNSAAAVGGQQVCQGIGGQQVCQLRPPVALHCLTVPTLAVSQLPTRPPVTQNLVASLPALPHSFTPAAPAQPTYQTLGPVSQEGSAAPQATPVHLSIPPYFYYVQEVSAVTEPSQQATWTYTSSS